VAEYRSVCLSASVEAFVDSIALRLYLPFEFLKERK